MKYRLICIWSYDSKSQQELSVTIEVCLNIGKSPISAFQRKVTVYDLFRDFSDQHNYVLNALAGTGQISQPFGFNLTQLELDKLFDVIIQIPFHFIKKGTSIKRISKDNLPTIFQNAAPKLQTGSLIGAELTVNSLGCWWNNIAIRFRYDNLINAIPINFTNIPCISDNGAPFLRDYDKEQAYLSSLSGVLNSIYSTLTLKNADTTSLRQAIASGWRIFVQKEGKGNHLNLKLVPNKYGIDWFTTSEGDIELEEDLATKLLTAFLKNQNFFESKDGNISIVDHKQLQEIPTSALAATVCPVFNISEIYSPILRLNSDERTYLNQTIKSDVCASLMDFQFEGVVWLTEMRKHNTGCLLADDMGLGKTLQTLAYLTTRPSNCIFLIIAPTSIVGNWMNELMKFTPHLQNRVTIASFDQLRISPKRFCNKEFDTLIIDEGQMVKNSNTQRHQSFAQIKRLHTIMLTGTPIENGIHEIWAQFDILIPGITELQKKLQRLAGSQSNNTFIELSRKLLSPFILRRTKDNVLDHFPHKHINNIYIKLNDNERDIYNRLKQIVVKAISDGVTGRVNSLVLTGLLRLRQACVCSQILPSNLQYHNVSLSSKFKEALKIIEFNISSGEKVLVFSQFTSALEIFRSILSGYNIGSYILTGSTTDRMRIVNDFNTHDDISVFLISLKAGGTGLNLTAASRVILLDDWWNPAVEEQAFARSYRIGQSQNVEIYRLICKNTIEEKIIELQDKKKNVSDLFNTDSGKLTIEDIKNLIEYS